MNQYIGGIKIGLYCLMLFMLLSRLVWIQIRQYDQPSQQQLVEILASDSNHLTKEVTSFFFKHHVFVNQIALLATVFSSAFMIRFISGSWLFALFSSNILLSRGSLITQIGFYETDLLIQMLLMFWLTGVAHFLRSGSFHIFCFSLLSLVLGFCLDELVIFMMLPMFLLLMLLKSSFLLKDHPTLANYRQKAIRKIDRMLPSTDFVLNTAIRKFSLVLETGSSFQRLSQYLSFSSEEQTSRLFSTLKEPFLVWFKTASDTKKLLKMTCFFLLLCTLAIFFNETHLLPRYAKKEVLEKDWITIFLEPIDFHYGICLCLLFFNLIHASSKGLKGVFEMSWLIVSTFIILAISSFIVYTFFSQQHLSMLLSTHRIAIWFEPIILSFGFAAFYHLIKIVSSRHL